MAEAVKIPGSGAGGSEPCRVSSPIAEMKPQSKQERFIQLAACTGFSPSSAAAAAGWLGRGTSRRERFMAGR